MVSDRVFAVGEYYGANAEAREISDVESDVLLAVRIDGAQQCGAAVEWMLAITGYARSDEVRNGICRAVLSPSPADDCQ